MSNILASFTLSKAQIQWSHMKPERNVLSVEVYSSIASCGLITFAGVKLIGRFKVLLDLKMAKTKMCLAHHGWVALRTNKKLKNMKNPKLHFSVRVEPDQKFMFEFDREPECNPKVFSDTWKQERNCFHMQVWNKKLGESY
ncbi:unnamed protein product [Eruca vesicaria subsp. sativa]|uniref:Uncharacterized protein n=1 Tax=Eruca vesicaria subsp. sativa TaxID=29727 RepID=A0ABC8KF34_ERUVS|nr:unnamed protein product [Eruca vesicaria subsp. sativa]